MFAEPSLTLPATIQQPLATGLIEVDGGVPCALAVASGIPVVAAPV
jgi:hypothetical protein